MINTTTETKTITTITAPFDVLSAAFDSVKAVDIDWDEVSDDPLGAMLESVWVTALDQMGEDSGVMVGRLDGPNSDDEINLLVAMNDGTVKPFGPDLGL